MENFVVYLFYPIMWFAIGWVWCRIYIIHKLGQYYKEDSIIHCDINERLFNYYNFITSLTKGLF